MITSISPKIPAATDRRRHYANPASATPTTLSTNTGARATIHSSPPTSIAVYNSSAAYAHGPTRRNQDRTPASASSGTYSFRTTQTSRTS